MANYARSELRELVSRWEGKNCNNCGFCRQYGAFEKSVGLYCSCPGRPEQLPKALYCEEYKLGDKK